MAPDDNAAATPRRERFNAAVETVRNDIGSLIQADAFTQQLAPPVLRQAVTAYPARSGKMLRPALLLWACGACGGRPKQAHYAAAAVEIFHTWTLVHDDIIDNDDLRRGLPSTHALVRYRALTENPQIGAAAGKVFGVNIAILAGDVQQAWANSLLLRCQRDEAPPAIVLAAVARMNNWLNPTLIAGEAIDVELEHRSPADCNPAEIEEMLRLKTGALLRFAAECGAAIGLASSDWEHPWIAALGEFAEKAGLAYQLQDDLLGVFGEEEKIGKPVGSDLRQGKCTLLLALAARAMSGPDRDRLRQMAGQGELSVAQLESARALLRDSGAVAAVEERARDLVRQAIAELDVLPEGEYRELLRDWANHVCRRSS